MQSSSSYKEKLAQYLNTENRNHQTNDLKNKNIPTRWWRGKKKAGACGHEGSIPSPPGYSAIPVKTSEKQQASNYFYVRQHRVHQDTQST